MDAARSQPICKAVLLPTLPRDREQLSIVQAQLLRDARAACRLAPRETRPTTTKRDDRPTTAWS
jgi:hypothetical protein